MTPEVKWFLIISMQIGLRQFEADVIEWLKAAAGGGEHTRSSLARQLCERSGWRNAKGELCQAQARKILPQLASALSIQLPAPSGAVPRPAELAQYAAAPSIDCELAQLGRVSVELVAGGETKPWRSMMRTHHPRGDPQHPGRALKYWVVSERHGRLGGVSFHAAAWHEKARDAYIGWTPRAAAENLSLVVNNGRFLILPGVRVHGLASTALALAAARVCGHWQAAYGEMPALAYTHIDAGRTGQSYRAAGWVRVGETSGRRCVSGGPKQVYVLGLSDRWRERLCARCAQRFRPQRSLYLCADAHWTDVEHGASSHPDGRVRKRLLSMGRAWEQAPGRSIPQVFAAQASRKAACRLLSSDNVTMDDILESHRQATVARSARCDTVLAVQDTTAINYDTQKNATRGLTAIGGTAQGIYAHANVAFSAGGRVLGVLDLDGEFRARCGADDDLKESVRWVEGLETAAELSHACGGAARVISVSDREGDLWEMFARQRQLRDQAGLLVRCHGARRRKVIDAHGRTEDLRRRVESLPAAATRAVEIQAQGGKRARVQRIATVTLRIAQVALKAPGPGADQVPVIAVSALEHAPPDGAKALNWLLLCTEGEADAANAARICQWYEARWGIEEYFRTLKTGCQVEQRQFDDVKDMLKCLAFDAIAAWRVLDLQRTAKAQPQRRAEEVAEPDELAVCQLLLHQLDRRCPIRPPPGLTVREYVVGLGKIAGFSPTRRQPIPGTKKIWQATTKLMISIQAINSCKATQ